MKYTLDDALFAYAKAYPDIVVGDPMVWCAQNKKGQELRFLSDFMNYLSDGWWEWASEPSDGIVTRRRSGTIDEIGRKFIVSIEDICKAVKTLTKIHMLKPNPMLIGEEQWWDYMHMNKLRHVSLTILFMFMDEKELIYEK